MKVTQRQLKQIIAEEIQKELKLQEGLGPVMALYKSDTPGGREMRAMVQTLDKTAAMKTVRTMCSKVEMGADLSPDDKTNIVASFIKASQFNPRGYGKGGHFDKCRAAVGL